MALTQKQRDERTALKRQKAGEEELRHRVRPGIKQAIQRIRDRADRIAVSELLQIATMKMDLMSDEELAAFLVYPRHEIMISENVAADFHAKSLMMIQKEPGDEIVSPS
ncbi:hypothetical protein [Pseudomonas viridiflava]|uniref:hypothetical protein n=1 Tax=Pseudomonas syringae TaxID=317 RepID=UPI000F02A33E